MACVRDIIATSGLAVRVHLAYKDAPDDGRYISEDVVTLQALIDKAAQHLKKTTISSDDRHHGQEVLKGCQGVLEDLMALIEKYKRLACINMKLVLNTVKVGKENITTLHVRLMSNTGLLTGFVRCCEYTEVKAQLAALLGLHGTINSGISTTSIASFAANTNTNIETAYKQFCDDLYRIGVPKDMIQQNKDKIFEILRSQDMVASNQIDVRGKERVLEAAYKEHCRSLYRLGFTDNMILQQKDEILRILRSRIMAASSKMKIKNNNSSSSTNMPSFRLTSRVNWFESNSEAGSAPPLDISVSHSHTGIVELVFGKGSSNDQDNHTPQLRATPLHAAAKGGYTWLAKLLLGSPSPTLPFSKGVSIEALDEKGHSPLQLAAMNGHTDIVDLLLSKGAPIEHVVGGETPLQYATQKGFTGVVELLLKQGASTEAVAYSSHHTPLHYAAIHGHTGIVELLLKQGASTKAKVQPSHHTPLHYAAEHGHTGIVELLLKKGASTEAKVQPSHYTSLHYAAKRGHTGIVELLLKQGASTGPQDNRDRTPLQAAALYGHTDVIDLFLSTPALIRAKGGFLLCSAAGSGSIGIVEHLLKRGVSVNAMDHDHTTPLDNAVVMGNTSVVELLLEKGASVNVVGINHRTPLHTAVFHSRTDIVKLLLEKGASLEAKDGWNKTPLQLAKLRHHPETTRLLTNKAAELRRAQPSLLTSIFRKK